MLLYPIEKQFDLPSLAVHFRNSQRSLNRIVVGQKEIDLSYLKVLIYNVSTRRSTS